MKNSNLSIDIFDEIYRHGNTIEIHINHWYALELIGKQMFEAENPVCKVFKRNLRDKELYFDYRFLDLFKVIEKLENMELDYDGIGNNKVLMLSTKKETPLEYFE